MKKCKFCDKPYDENEYHYEDFCCLLHYIYENCLVFNDYEFEKYKKEINEMIPEMVYLELLNGLGELNVEKTELYLNAISKDKNAINLLLSNENILYRFYFDEYVCMIKLFPIEYTQKILDALQIKYDNECIIGRLTHQLKYIAEDKREIAQSFTIACALEGDN